MSSGRTGVLAVLVTAGNPPYLRRPLVALARRAHGRAAGPF